MPGEFFLHSAIFPVSQGFGTVISQNFADRPITKFCKTLCVLFEPLCMIFPEVAFP